MARQFLVDLLSLSPQQQQKNLSQIILYKNVLNF